MTPFLGIQVDRCGWKTSKNCHNCVMCNLQASNSRPYVACYIDVYFVFVARYLPHRVHRVDGEYWIQLTWWLSGLAYMQQLYLLTKVLPCQILALCQCNWNLHGVCVCMCWAMCNGQCASSCNRHAYCFAAAAFSSVDAQLIVRNIREEKQIQRKYCCVMCYAICMNNKRFECDKIFLGRRRWRWASTTQWHAEKGKK